VRLLAIIKHLYQDAQFNDKDDLNLLVCYTDMIIRGFQSSCILRRVDR